MARLRVFGVPTAGARAALADRFLRLLPGPQLVALLRTAGVAAQEADRLALAQAGVADLPAAVRAGFRLDSSV
jgi:allantoicase